MSRIRPYILSIAGVLLLIGGFVYDLIFAGIPYQDPTPEMAARFAHHSHIASLIELVGGGVFLISFITAILRRVMRRNRRPLDP